MIKRKSLKDFFLPPVSLIRLLDISISLYNISVIKIWYICNIVATDASKTLSVHPLRFLLSWVFFFIRFVLFIFSFSLESRLGCLVGRTDAVPYWWFQDTIDERPIGTRIKIGSARCKNVVLLFAHYRTIEKGNCASRVGSRIGKNVQQPDITSYNRFVQAFATHCLLFYYFVRFFQVSLTYSRLGRCRSRFRPLL